MRNMKKLLIKNRIDACKCGKSSAEYVPSGADSYEALLMNCKKSKEGFVCDSCNSVMSKPDFDTIDYIYYKIPVDLDLSKIKFTGDSKLKKALSREFCKQIGYHGYKTYHFAKIIGAKRSKVDNWKNNEIPLHQFCASMVFLNVPVLLVNN